MKHSPLPDVIVMDREDGKWICMHLYIHRKPWTQTYIQNLGQKENGLLCWQQLFANPHP